MIIIKPIIILLMSFTVIARGLQLDLNGTITTKTQEGSLLFAHNVFSSFGFMTTGELYDFENSGGFSTFTFTPQWRGGNKMIGLGPLVYWENPEYVEAISSIPESPMFWGGGVSLATKDFNGFLGGGEWFIYFLGARSFSKVINISRVIGLSRVININIDKIELSLFVGKVDYQEGRIVVNGKPTIRMVGDLTILYPLSSHLGVSYQPGLCFIYHRFRCEYPTKNVDFSNKVIRFPNRLGVRWRVGPVGITGGIIGDVGVLEIEGHERFPDMGQKDYRGYYYPLGIGITLNLEVTL